MLSLNKEDDVVLYQEICKLDDQLNIEVKKLQTWFENIEKRVMEAVHDCANEIMR